MALRRLPRQRVKEIDVWIKTIGNLLPKDEENVHKTNSSGHYHLMKSLGMSESSSFGSTRAVLDESGIGMEVEKIQIKNAKFL